MSPVDERDRVLLVDDDEDASELLALLLERRGYRVERARDARSALERAALFHPRAVVSDLDLGDPIDGYELARSLRRALDLDGALLVALSGHASARVKERALEAGFHEHFAKPVKVDALVARLARHLRSDGRSPSFD